MAKNPRPLPLGGELQPTIERLRAIAADAGDRLLLADGPPNPDAALLDLCADIAQQRKVADAAWDRWRRATGHDPRHPSYEEARSEARRLAVLLKRASK